MRRCVIIGGAKITQYERVRSYLQEDDFIICCDSGLYHQEGLEVTPDLIVGDFDSHPMPEACEKRQDANMQCEIGHRSDAWMEQHPEIIVLPCEKDDTDTFFAAKEALRRGFRDFLLLGAVGGRLDHTLGNLSVLQMLHGKGCHAVLVDDFSEMEMVGKTPVSVDDTVSFFSLLNISGVARDIHITNAKYPLDGGEITCDYQYGISNEVLPGRVATVSVGEGALLLLRVVREDERF